MSLLDDLYNSQSFKNERLLEKLADEPNLTDEELQQKIEAYKQLGLSGPTANLDVIRRMLVDKLNAGDVQGRVKGQAGERVNLGRAFKNSSIAVINPSLVAPGVVAGITGSRGDDGPTNEAQAGYRPIIEEVLAEFVAMNRRLPDIGEFRDAVTGVDQRFQARGDAQTAQNLISDTAFSNFLNDQNNNNAFAFELARKDYSPDIKRIEELLGGRRYVRDANAKVEDFNKSSQEQQELARQSFFDAQRRRATDYVGEEYAPYVAEQLNARGLGDSGQVGASVKSKYSSLLSGIEESELSQLQDDVDYYANQAYQKTFGDLVAARADVSKQIDTEREKLRTEQLRGFTKRQSDLEKEFNLDQFKTQSENAYKNYEKQVKAQNEKEKDAEDANLINQVAQTGTTVAIASML